MATTAAAGAVTAVAGRQRRRWGGDGGGSAAVVSDFGGGDFGGFRRLLEPALQPGRHTGFLQVKALQHGAHGLLVQLALVALTDQCGPLGGHTSRYKVENTSERSVCASGSGISSASCECRRFVADLGEHVRVEALGRIGLEPGQHLVGGAVQPPARP